MTIIDPPPIKSSPYEMTINLNVLNHLGIGLYNNVPAVLSEIVANAWDADATDVHIDIDKEKGEIVVYDNGVGMSEEDINERYLNVGYRKRDEMPGKTPGNCEPMGRKGIGKLSVFSIANTVEVYSTKNGERNAFRMNTDDIKKQIKSREKTGVYRPVPLDHDLVDFDRGTKISLRDLTKRLISAERFLRRRLARRFSIIGAKYDFAVILNGVPISAKDRGYYNKMEFIWHLGGLENLEEDFFEEQEGRRNLRQNVRKHFEVSETVDSALGWTATGWIGTIDEQKSIDEDNNTIAVLARGKLIHEDVLKDLKEGDVYSKYLVGEVHADFMNTNSLPDIVTSDRQSVKQDDERYQKLKDFVRAILKKSRINGAISATR